jgi:hypothetical protein
MRVLTANGDDLTDSSDPSRKMMRQIAGAFHEYEKARLVAKLKAARERTRAAKGKCEGRKSWAEINPELVREAKRLRRRSPKGHQRSLRDVAAELAKLGFVNELGTQFSPSSVQSMIAATFISPVRPVVERRESRPLAAAENQLSGFNVCAGPLLSSQENPASRKRRTRFSATRSRSSNC